MFLRQGYRFCKVLPDGIGVFYKYYQEGFHVVMIINQKQGYSVIPEQLNAMEERVMDLFYHPQGRLKNFPEGFPVYHVETLILLIGGDQNVIRELCSAHQNVWVYMPIDKRLLIYENQPGDFWGLRDAIEAEGSRKDDAGNIGHLKEKLKNIKNLPYITASLAAVNVIVYIILEIMGDTENVLFIAAHGGMYPDFILYKHQWWRIITAAFIHFGAVHLLNNMVIFCLVGARLERAAGHIRMLLIYLLSGAGGGMFSYFMMLRTGDYAVSAGASGAVFGTIGGLLWAVIIHRGHFEGLTAKGLIFMLVLSLYYGFSTIGVDNWGHVGGMVSGFVAAIILYHRKRQNC